MTNLGWKLETRKWKFGLPVEDQTTTGYGFGQKAND
jgi:hypothetical protein